MMSNTCDSKCSKPVRQQQLTVLETSTLPDAGVHDLKSQHNKNSESITIKTSKKWVLPPRPRPGRKSNHRQSIAKEPERRNEPAASGQTRTLKDEDDFISEINRNPLKQAIVKINEENYFLKLEVIRLVSDLKCLKNEVADIKKAKASRKPILTPTEILRNTKKPAAQTPHGRKRVHGNEVDDLVASLVDLSHVEKSAPNCGFQQVIDMQRSDTVETQFDVTMDYINLEPKQTTFMTNCDHSDHHSEDELESGSLTPHSLVSLTKTNSTIDDYEISHRNEIVSASNLPTLHEEKDAHIPLIDIEPSSSFSEFTFWSSSYNSSIVLHTDASMKELAAKREHEREAELKKYNAMNDLMEFEHHYDTIDDNSWDFDRFVAGTQRDCDFC